MANAVRIGTCCLCGEEKPLTIEHIPPRKAFNDCTVLMHSVDKAAGPELRFAPSEPADQGGHHKRTLCAKCNNDTGGWYGRSYVEFVRACARVAIERNANRTISLSTNVLPLRVMKEALVIMCSSCGPGLTDKHGGLRRLLLSKSSRGLPWPLRLYAYIMCHEGGRSSGVAGIAQMGSDDLQLRNTRIVSEFAWWPLGLVLSFDSMPMRDVVEVSHWLDYRYDEKLALSVDLPCRWAVTLYPLDHCSVEQVERDRAENQRREREEVDENAGG